MNEHIHGIIPPMITPFRADGTIDLDALRAEARYLIETAQVHGLAVAGSTGEGHKLSTQETRDVTGVVAQEAAGRVPIITGIMANSTAAAIERGMTRVSCWLAAPMSAIEKCFNAPHET